MRRLCGPPGGGGVNVPIPIRSLLLLGLSIGLLTRPLPAQESAAASAAKPTQHVIGTVTSADNAAHTISVKQDKTGTEYVVAVGNTRTLLRVQPGAKDLKSAVRITDSDFKPGDRVDVRAFTGEQPDHLSARSVVLMSAGDLQQHRQEELQAWQNSTVATVTAVSPSGDSLGVSTRTPEGRKTMTVRVTPSTQFTRYSPANPNTAAPSTITAIEPGDQLHIIGDKSGDADTITAQKIYSAPTRTIAGTVLSIDPSGKQLVVRDLQTKQPVTIDIASGTAVRKLPEQMATMMAARLNHNRGGQGTAESRQGEEGEPPHPAMVPGGAPAGHGYGGMNRGGGDMNRMLQRVPEISVSDLKPGAAVVIWGLAGQQPGTITANTVLAGVEPVLQSAAPRRGESLNSDWGLDMSVPE